MTPEKRELAMHKLIGQVWHHKFQFHGDWGDALGKRQFKLRFLQELKRVLGRAYDFTPFQAEFVINEAMTSVLLKSNEDMLVAKDPRKAAKLVRASFNRAGHYYRFLYGSEKQ